MVAQIRRTGKNKRLEKSKVELHFKNKTKLQKRPPEQESKP